MLVRYFFFTETAPTKIYTLSLHDALPIFAGSVKLSSRGPVFYRDRRVGLGEQAFGMMKRSEEHTSELQSRGHLVCRLLLEKKKGKALAAALPGVVVVHRVDAPDARHAEMV